MSLTERDHASARPAGDNNGRSGEALYTENSIDACRYLPATAPGPRQERTLETHLDRSQQVATRRPPAVVSDNPGRRSPRASRSPDCLASTKWNEETFPPAK